MDSDWPIRQICFLILVKSFRAAMSEERNTYHFVAVSPVESVKPISDKHKHNRAVYVQRAGLET